MEFGGAPTRCLNAAKIVEEYESVTKLMVTPD